MREVALRCMREVALRCMREVALRCMCEVAMRSMREVALRWFVPGKGFSYCSPPQGAILGLALMDMAHQPCSGLRSP
jgi:hypothetical protein